MQSDVLAAIDGPALRAYVAWVPILPDDSLAAAQEARGLVPDRRAAHFWDAERALPDPFSAVLGLPAGSPAWDVYLAYPAGAVWDARPPAPAFWHHQLGDLDIAPRLDAERFAAQLRALLEDTEGDTDA